MNILNLQIRKMILIGQFVFRTQALTQDRAKSPSTLRTKDPIGQKDNKTNNYEIWVWSTRLIWYVCRLWDMVFSWRFER